MGGETLNPNLGGRGGGGVNTRGRTLMRVPGKHQSLSLHIAPEPERSKHLGFRVKVLGLKV